MDSLARTRVRNRGTRRAIACAVVYARTMEQRVEFRSDGLRLSGVLHVPDDRKAGERRPAFMVLHGFGSNKDSGVPRTAAELFASLGYVALRFDMRGCGESEGARGRVICLEQVEDTRHALEFLQTRAEVTPDRIAGYGQSFGAAVAVYAAADTVTPTEQSIDLFQHAGQPTDLHLVAGVDHFLMSESNALVMDIVRDWLAQRFPAR